MGAGAHDDANATKCFSTLVEHKTLIRCIQCSSRNVAT